MVLFISQGKDVYKAWEEARIWRNVSLALLVFQALSFEIGVITGGCPVWCVLKYILVAETGYVVWCTSLVFIVIKYMVELETAIVSVRVGAVRVAGAQAG